MKFLKVYLAIVFLIFFGNDLNAQTGNQEIIDDINDFLQTIYQGYYQLNSLIDLDAHLGDSRYYDLPTEDPYGTIEDCYLFIAEEKNGPNYGTQSFQPVGNIVGIYKDAAVVWYSDINEIGIETGYNLFTTRDINNDGNVEILITSGYGTELWIYSWDGTTGERINDNEDWFSVIQGPEGSFTLFDAEGDGILEIRSLAKRDGSETWSWNGELYGKWPNTPIMSDTSWFPRNNVIVNVNCELNEENNLYSYNYSIYNDAESKQRINYFTIESGTDSIMKSQPTGWAGRRHWVWDQEGWGTSVFYWYKPKEILPGQSLDSFKIVSPDLPFISLYVARGENMLPLTTEYTSEEDSTDFVNNSKKGFTIGPSNLPNPFIPSDFLDTLINYNQRSYELGWITNQTTANKYDTLFNTAKTLLEGNHIPYVESTLQTVIDECNEDSSGNITSEAYALLRYNTEYLLENLPEIIPPLLNSLTPEAAFIYINADLSDFTVTAYGGQFNDSSVVYFNGNAKTTTYVSDSILTFEVQITSDIPATGDYPIWISNYGSNSDTLIFSRVGSLAQTIVPIFDCVQNNGDGTFTAFYGYNNNNSYSVYIPLGFNNYFESLIFPDRGQPKVFLPGSQTDVFSVNFDGNNLTWTLVGTSVTANKKSTPCP